MSPTISNPAEAESLQHTPLHALHLSRRARMVPFAGYDMPLQYEHGIRHEHEHTRRAAGLFDVSHMGQIRITGADAAGALEGLVTGDITGLGDRHLRYTLFTNDAGGIIDDLIAARIPDGLFLVVNAARRERDITHLNKGLRSGCHAELLDERALLALQGPEAAAVLRGFNPGIDQLRFMQAGDFDLDGTQCFISRSGYTGEDGFEMSVPPDRAESLAERMLEHEQVEPVGLGARDTLRMETGLCLYGHELDEETTPVEAGLVWTVAKKYRNGGTPARFPGAERILQQAKTGTDRKRVGLKPVARAPVREGTPVSDERGKTVGRVTSGGFGPTVGGPIAMAYVDTACSDIDTVLHVTVRNRSYDVIVTGLPFIETRYHKTRRE